VPFGSERALIAPSRGHALYYRLYGAARVGDKARAWYVLPYVYGYLRRAARLLDAGCGMGFYSLHLACRFPQAEIQALDCDEQHLASLSRMAAKLGLKNLHPWQGDLLSFEPGPQFDCALCVDVLEHIDRDQDAIRRLAGSLKPGGVLIAHVPQTRQRHYLPQRGDFHTWDHIREGYSPADLEDLVQQSGLQLVASRNTFGLLGTLAADLDEYWQHAKPVWLALLPLILLLARLDPALPHRRGNGLLVVARKPAAEGTP
jgi:SAM-dependent methyltransferase